MLETPQLDGDTVYPWQTALRRAGGPQVEEWELGDAKIHPDRTHLHLHLRHWWGLSFGLVLGSLWGR